MADTQFNAPLLVMLTRREATLNCEVGLVKVTSVPTETTSGHISDKIANRKLWKSNFQLLMENTVIKIPIKSFTFFNILNMVSYSLPERGQKSFTNILYVSKRVQIGLVAQE